MLLKSERKRKAEYLALYKSVLESITGKQDPTSLQYVEARCIAADLWVYQRHCGSAKALDALKLATSMGPAEARRQSYRDMDDRTRLRAMAVHSVKQTRDIFSTLGRSVDPFHQRIPDNLVPLRRGGKG